MMNRLLNADTRVVARGLIGFVLATQTSDGTYTAGRIVETEAYLQHDPASHSYRGETKRNAPMFAPPGTLYVYRSYGVHWCVNVVTAPVGVGEAALIRALEPIAGIEVMRRRRGRDTALCSGPGNVCQALGIDGSVSGVHIDETTAPRVTLTPPDIAPSDEEIIAAPRIGISRATEHYWRFCLSGSRAVSRPRPR